jgi:hypothetical protein
MFRVSQFFHFENRVSFDFDLSSFEPFDEYYESICFALREISKFHELLGRLGSYLLLRRFPGQSSAFNNRMIRIRIRSSPNSQRDTSHDNGSFTPAISQ